MKGSALVFFVAGIVLIWAAFTGRLPALWQALTNPPAPAGAKKS